ncbi:uncharacterized protein [Tenebrio molitor]
MVVTVFWTRSWTVPIISVSVLCVAVIFLLCCLCVVKKRSDSMRMSIQPRKKFFSISNSSLNKLMIFRSYDLSKNESAAATVPIQKQGSEADLLDSVDLSEKFGSSRLQIAESDQEEMGSCGSTDSKFTFYSTYQGLARSESAVSVASTYKSTRNSSAKNSTANHKSSSSLCIV